MRIKIGKGDGYCTCATLNEFYYHISRWLGLEGQEGCLSRTIWIISYKRDSLQHQTFASQKARCGNWLHWKMSTRGDIIEDRVALAACAAAKLVADPDEDETEEAPRQQSRVEMVVDLYSSLVANKEEPTNPAHLQSLRELLSSLARGPKLQLDPAEARTAQNKITCPAEEVAKRRSLRCRGKVRGFKGG